MGFIGGVLDAVRARSSGDSTLAKPAEWLTSLLGGGYSKAGVHINENNADTLSSVWACVRAISEDCSKLPLKVYRRVDDDGGREVVRSHPAMRVFNLAANSGLATPMAVRSYLLASTLIWGNGFAEIERNNANRPIGLWPLDPAAMRLKVDQATGQLVYVYRNDNGREVELSAMDVLHIRGPTKDGMVGHSVVSKARESLGAAMATDHFTARFWANGARPSGAIVRPKEVPRLSDPAFVRLRESVQSMYAGASNAGRPILLEEGMTWQPFSVPPEDAQFLETRQFSVIEVCRWFRVPPHKVFSLDKATFSNIEHQSLEYVTDGLGAWMKRIEEEANLKLLAGTELSSHYHEHLTAALLRGDLKSRYEAYMAGRQAGFLSVNEIRRLENMNSIGEDGDQYLAPTNMTTPAKLAAAPAPGDSPPAAPDLAEPDPDPADDEEPKKPDKRSVVEAIAAAMETVLDDAVRRIARIEADRARRAAKGGEPKFHAWVEEYFRDRIPEISVALFPAIEGMGRMCRAVGFDDLFVPSLVAELAGEHVTTARSYWAAPSQWGSSGAEIIRRADEWEKKRPDVVASAWRSMILARLPQEALPCP